MEKWEYLTVPLKQKKLYGPKKKLLSGKAEGEGKLVSVKWEAAYITEQLNVYGQAGWSWCPVFPRFMWKEAAAK